MAAQDALFGCCQSLIERFTAAIGVFGSKDHSVLSTLQIYMPLNSCQKLLTVLFTKPLSKQCDSAKFAHPGHPCKVLEIQSTP